MRWLLNKDLAVPLTLAGDPHIWKRTRPASQHRMDPDAIHSLDRLCHGAALALISFYKYLPRVRIQDT